MTSSPFTAPEPRGPHAAEPEPDTQRPAVGAELERDLVAILTCARNSDDGHEQAFARKERAFVARCDDLPLVEALALHRRLVNPQPGDVLVEPFQRLVVERRNRILAFLAAARRRAALATTR